MCFLRKRTAALKLEFASWVSLLLSYRFVGQINGRTDGRTPDHYIDPAPQSAYYTGSVRTATTEITKHTQLLTV